MQIIICEGIHDESKIKEVYPNAFVITTNGREIADSTLKMIKEYSLNNEIILFLDPDAPGERIRSIISEIVPSAKHAFIRKKDGISKDHKKVGIEHATKEVIKEALDKVYSSNNINKLYDFNDLYQLNLIGCDNSKERRDYISNKLNIGTPNAKTFLKRINQFNIEIDLIERYLKEYEESNS